MGTWLLQLDLEENRRVIVGAGSAGSEFRLTLREIEAADWMAAKAALGCEQTPLQEEMAPLGEEERARVLQRERWFGFGGAVFGVRDREELKRNNAGGWVYKH